MSKEAGILGMLLPKSMVEVSMLTHASLNIPGKAREPLCFGGGLPLYRSEIKKAIVPDWKGFTVS